MGTVERSEDSNRHLPELQQSPTPLTTYTTFTIINNNEKSYPPRVCGILIGDALGEGKACGRPRVAEWERGERLLEACSEDTSVQRAGRRENMPGNQRSKFWVVL